MTDTFPTPPPGRTFHDHRDTTETPPDGDDTLLDRRECAGCGAVFYTYRDRRYCSTRRCPGLP